MYQQLDPLQSEMKDDEYRAQPVRQIILHLNATIERS
jgi:hypothetical protein